MNYLRIYKALMTKALGRTLQGYSESHHIVPRCMGGSDEAHNLVRLTPEEHYLAHQLLCRIHPEDHRLAYAALMMCAARPSNKLYGWLRRRQSAFMKAHNPNAGGHSRRCHNAIYGAPKYGPWADDDPRRDPLSGRLKVQNPMAGKRPWEHSRSTPETIAIWADAQRYHDWWIATQRSYHSMALAFGFEAPTMTHNRIVTLFKAGWIPENDRVWTKFSNDRKMEMQNTASNTIDHVYLELDTSAYMFWQSSEGHQGHSLVPEIANWLLLNTTAEWFTGRDWFFKSRIRHFITFDDPRDADEFKKAWPHAWHKM